MHNYVESTQALLALDLPFRNMSQDPMKSELGESLI